MGRPNVGVPLGHGAGDLSSHTKIRHLDLTRLCYQDIARFDVPVYLHTSRPSVSGHTLCACHEIGHPLKPQLHGQPWQVLTLSRGGVISYDHAGPLSLQDLLTPQEVAGSSHYLPNGVEVCQAC